MYLSVKSLKQEIASENTSPTQNGKLICYLRGCTLYNHSTTIKITLVPI